MNFSNRGKKCLSDAFRLQLVIIGPLMVIGVYSLIGLHVYAYVRFLVGPLYRRIGVWPAICWQMIGMVLCYNICYNHFLAMVIKPGSFGDLKRVEQLRELFKRR